MPLATRTPESAPAATPRSWLDRVRPTGQWSTLAIVAVAVAVAGLALRVWVFHSPLGGVDADEAAGTLLARHMAEGEFSTFLWANSYGGTLEAIVATPLIWVWDSPLVLKVVMVAMYALACVLTWRVGLRTVGRHAAVLAGAGLWLAPAPFVLASTKGRLYYGSALVLALAVLLLCLRLADEPRRRDMALLGLTVGLGLWTAPFVFYVAAPALVWLFLARRSLWRLVPFAVPTGVLGALPWIRFNLDTGWASFTQRAAPPTSYRDRFDSFFTELVPRSLDLKRTTGSWVAGGAGRLLYVALLVAFAAFLGRGLVRRSAPLVPLVVICCAYPFLFAAPDASWFVIEPRYGLFLAPVLLLLAAAGLVALPRREVVAPAALSVLVVLSATSLGWLADFGRDHPGHHDLTPPDTRPLVAHLDRAGVTAAFGDYWLAYPVVLATRERILVVPTGDSRYPPYDARLRAAGGERNWVQFSGSLQDVELRKGLAKRGIDYQATPVAEFTVYRLAEGLLPEDLTEDQQENASGSAAG